MGKMGQSYLPNLHNSENNSTLCRNLGTKHILKIISFYYILVGSGSGSGQRPLREPLGKAAELFHFPLQRFYFQILSRKKACQGEDLRAFLNSLIVHSSNISKEVVSNCEDRYLYFSSFCWQTFFSSISRDLATLGRNKKVKAKKAKITTKLMSPGGSLLGTKKCT